MKIIRYEIKKLIDNEIVNFVTISFKKNIKKPIRIDKNRTLKKLSFLENLPENPITINDNITINKGLTISDK